MNLEISLERVNQLMACFVTEIKGAAAMGRTDLNKAAETILMPLLNEIYGWNLENVNYVESNNNYPSIDLADKSARVCVQITATTSAAKVKHTLEQFTKHEQYVEYDRLVVFFLQEKRQSYPSKTIQKITQNKFSFDIKRDLLDYRNLLGEIASFQIERVTKVREILEANFGGSQEAEYRPNRNQIERSNTTKRFEEYLYSICEYYQNYWRHYVFIDEIDDSTWFEFTLDAKVETQQQQENESQQGSESQQTKRKPILQAIQELGEQSLLIFGSSGSGKSTLLSKLFYESALKSQKGESDVIPVLIELKSYETTGEDGGLEGLILSFLQSHDPDLNKEDLRQIRKKKRLALFIDGFNELPSERAKPKIKQYCKNVLTIATSRNEGDWRELGQRLEIQPLTHDEVIAFFKKRLPNTSQEKLKELGNRVRDFGDTPLMVWMLYCIFNTNKNIPETHGKVYQRFTTLYLERSKEGIDLPESRALLSRLAFEMMQSSNTGNLTDFRLEISETDAQNILGSEQKLKLLRNCHLLKSHGKPGNRRIKFCHQSLQEYYAAEELLLKFQEKHLESTDAQLFQYFYLNQRKWTESIALMLSILEDSDYIDKIIKLACSVDLFLGARLVGATRQELQNNFLNLFSIDKYPKWLQIHLLSEIDSLRVSEILLGFLGDSDVEICKRAVWASRKLKPLFAKPIISEALKSRNSSVRETAARTLSILDKNEAFEIARHILHTETEADVRMAIVLHVLGKDNSEESISELLRTAQDSDHSVSAMASYQVEKMMPEISPLLIEFLRHRESTICKSAIEVLARVGDKTCLTSLFEAKLSSDDEIHIEACIAIRKIKSRIHSTSPSALKAKIASKQQQINGNCSGVDESMRVSSVALQVS